MSAAVVEATGLTKRYGATVGLADLDLSVRPGEVLGLLGPNGSGKTTTLRLLLDLIRPTAGTARLFGRRPGETAVRARVGYLPGDLVLDERLTGAAMLSLLDALRSRGGRPADPARRAALCERLALSSADLDRVLRHCSRGTRQKVGLVAALQHDPELLVLDEPTSALDPLVREELFALMAETASAGRTVFHSSHVLSEVARTCSRVAVLRAGRLVALEDTATLAERLTRRVLVSFDGPVPREELSIPGVELLSVDGARAELAVSGPLGPLLEALAGRGVHDLSLPEPRLEDALRRWFERPGEQADGEARAAAHRAPRTETR